MKAVRLVAVWNASAVEGWYTTEKEIMKSAHVFRFESQHTSSMFSLPTLKTGEDSSPRNFQIPLQEL